jgi:predicted glycosyltransferase
LIWIIHIPFFQPILEEFKSRGFSTVMSARNCYQVCGLVDLFNFDCSIVGKHHGKNKLFKTLGMIMRSCQLVQYARKNKPDIALSHGSRAQLIAAKVLGIPVVITMDYEFGQKIPFFHPRMFIVPEVLAENDCWSHAIVRSYPGIKEDIYVPFFKPCPEILTELAIDGSNLLVTIRPPATEAHYHNPKSDELFVRSIQYLSEQPGLQMILLPRTERQAEWVKHEWPRLVSTRKMVIPPNVVNGLDLIWYSDIVISGGGTMNREAAALNVPVYSIYKGKIGAVDRYLSDQGRLILIDSADDIPRTLVLKKRARPAQWDFTHNRSLHCFVNIIAEHFSMSA